MSNYIKAQSRGVHEFELKDEKKLRHFPRLVEFAESKRKRVLDHGLFKVSTSVDKRCAFICVLNMSLMIDLY